MKAIQIYMIIISLWMGSGHYNEYVKSMNGRPFEKNEYGALLFRCSLPVDIALFVSICLEVIPYRKRIECKGMSVDEYEQLVFEKTPPEIIIKAQEYEDNFSELNEYLFSKKEELGFDKEEMDMLCSICYNPAKELERREAEKEKNKKV